jgi:imidazolonepropionase-like amidohydrolase
MSGKTRARRLSACLAFALAATFSPTAQAAPSPSPVTIADVTVLSMVKGETAMSHADVVIAGGRIEAVRPHTAGPCPSPCIDGRGKWLIPGLTDAHVHIPNDRLAQLYMRLPELPRGATDSAAVFLPYVANGVTQVFDLAAMPETLVQQEDIRSGRALGPHIVRAFLIDGAPPLLPEGVGHGVSGPEAGREAVKIAAAEGYDLIKVYSALDLPTFQAVIDEAGKHGLKVIGHIPGREQGLTDRFIVPGFDAVAHAEEYAFQTHEPDAALIPAYAAMARKSGTALVTTLTLDERLVEEMSDKDSLKRRREFDYTDPLYRSLVFEHNPYVAMASPGLIEHIRRTVQFNARLVKTFNDAGVPVMAGTDALTPGVMPGFALPDELEAMQRAGLSPYQVLRSATATPCEWLGKADECGHIAPGQRADLVLLDADPSADIGNVRRISGVMIDGVFLPAGELSNRLAALARRYAAPASDR